MLKLPEALLKRDDINSAAFRVYAQLAWLSQKRESDKIAVSQTYLSDTCNLSLRTVQTQINKLVEVGIIERVRQHKESRGKDANLYILKEIE